MTSTAPIRVRSAKSEAAPQSFASLRELARARHALPDLPAALLLRESLPPSLRAEPLIHAAALLWTANLRVDAADPHWPDRDRVVAGGAVARGLLPAMLRLSGQAADCVTTEAPPGQEFGTAVGLALAERFLATRFGRSLVDHRCWLLTHAADLATGAGFEAAWLAGRLRLDKLTVLAADDDASPEAGEVALRVATTLGWTARRVAAADLPALTAALATAARGRKPTLLLCTPSGRERAEPNALSAELSAGLAARWRAGGVRGAVARRGWLKRVARHPQRAELERALAGRRADAVYEALSGLRVSIAEGQPQAAVSSAFDAIAAAMPELVLASAGAPEPGLAAARGLSRVAAEQFAGRHLALDRCQAGLAAILGGLAAHGGVLPVAAARTACLDDLATALHSAARLHRRVVFVLEQDDDADNPALSALRAIANLLVLRPADPIETAECWDIALRRGEGPSVLVTNAAASAPLRHDTTENRCARGGYVLAEANGPRRATLIAAGGDLALALAARAELAAEGIPVAVVSLPSWELFAQADPAYRSHVLGAAPRLGMETGHGAGWEDWLGDGGAFLSLGADAASHAVVSAAKRIITA